MAIDRAYLLSLPERLVRSVVALGAGLTREVGEVALPDAVRHAQLYQNLVETTLRFLIERVGGAEGVYEADGLERTSSRMASTINTPPLDVAELRKDWHAIRQEARALTPKSLPSPEVVTDLWDRLRTEAARQEMSVFGASSMMAVSAVRGVPDHLRWLSTSTTVGAGRVGQVLAGALLDHYRRTLDEARAAGFATYANAQLGPYVRAAAAQFSPERRSLTENLLDRRDKR